jgi:hypothetical protein
MNKEELFLSKSWHVTLLERVTSLSVSWDVCCSKDFLERVFKVETTRGVTAYIIVTMVMPHCR